MIPNRKFAPEQVVIRNEETKQDGSREHGRSHPALSNPRGDKSGREGRDGSQGQPGELHCEGKIEGGFGLMIVRPGDAQGQIQDGGDKDPRGQGGENSANRLEGRMGVGGAIGLGMYRG